MEKYKGSVEKILYQDATSGYGVIKILVEQQTLVTATGTFPVIGVGQEVQITGTWVVHPRFGRQFQVEQYYSTTPTSLKGLIAYLGSGSMKGIGPSYAERLVATFGTDVLRVIDEEPHQLNKVPGLGSKRIEMIRESWTMHKELAYLMVFLQDKGLSITYANKLYKQYRNQTIAVLRENPYRLIDDIWGIGFTIADTIAQKMGVGTTSYQRISSGIRFCLRKAGQQGHLYLPEHRLFAEAHQLLNIDPEDTCLTVVVQQLYLQKIILVLHVNDQRFVALPAAYEAEKTVAERIIMLQKNSAWCSLTSEQIQTTLNTTNSQVIKLSDEQKKAIITALIHRVSIITGGPGTGKTTLLGSLLMLLEAHHITYKLTAPTGRAAKRMSESCKRPASTIHRLLDFDYATGAFKHQKDHPIKADVIIIDECSMIDIMLAQALLTALSDHTTLILLGDIDQLPPVGPGNFFRDCIASNIIPTMRLTRIFRQGEGSSISYNAHRIRAGAFPIAAANQQSDFICITESDPTQLPVHLKRIILSEAAQRGHSPCEVTMLCPMHRGTAGTQQMNSFLQQLLNPTSQSSFTCRTITFKLNDRVMQLRNNYSKMVFNGDHGVISQIDHESQSFIVTYDDKAVTYQFDEAEEIMLAYAISIHKSQGSEFPIVVIPIFMQHFTMLRRNLIYTALTRARKLCVLVGEKRAIACALRTLDTTTRVTFLTEMLISVAQGDVCVAGSPSLRSSVQP